MKASFPAAALPAAALVLAVLPAVAEEATGLGTALLFEGAPRVQFSSLEPAREGGGVTLLLPDPASPGDLRILRATLGQSATTDEDREGSIETFGLAVPVVVPAIGFALLDPAPEVDVTDGQLRVDVTGDGTPETLSACLTTEGMQLRAVNGEGDEVWQGYVPLGYDVEPTCP